MLIPAIGSRSITYIFALTLAGCATILFFTAARRPA
jgi:hypothetical protein